jgi:hypothetical protein
LRGIYPESPLKGRGRGWEEFRKERKIGRMGVKLREGMKEDGKGNGKEKEKEMK